jgi:O-antigen ligase/polysaccharide polymerase Wzy-like membrane protein
MIVAIYLFLVLLSEQFVWHIEGLALSPVRIFLVLLFVPTLVALFGQRDLRIQAFDVLVLFSVLWIIAAIIANNGLERGIKFGGSLALEALGGYIVGRAYVRTPQDVVVMVRWYVLLVAATIPFALSEAVTGARVFGMLPAPAEPFMRFGLHRAAVTFSHAILYGVFCAVSFGLAWFVFSKASTRYFALGIILFATFLSLSSASLLACFLAAVFIVWERVTRWMPARVAITVLGIVAMFGVIELASNRTAMAVLLQFVSLDYWTAYFRLLIWEYATANIANSPWVGIGLNPWVRPSWMPPSIDSFWLVYAVLAGLPMVTMLACGMLLLLWRVSKRAAPVAPQQWQRVRLGWTVALLAISQQAFTVHYWGAMNSFFFFLVGMGAWMTDAGMGARVASSRVRPKGIVHRPRGLVAAKD